MNEQKNDEKLKRISFISGEDFYYLTYLALICLKEFSSKKLIFKDHRKMTYLMQVISSPVAVNLLIENFNRHTLKPFDKEFLFDVYVKASLHQREVYKIVRNLERKGFVSLLDTDKVNCYNIEIKDKEKLNLFFDTKVFDKEIQSAAIFKTHFKNINALGLDGLINKLFTEYGLKVWAN
ncbi:hypothetical protein J3D56_001841 [Erwinia persicina]|uniref:hypothetical protein n=1 Tax=Erwinia persicina TaxID=55211 RepID=UPI00209D0926|nr:hypothetical protein [Erwinia persicina]MCP1438405.1 hypothetical protein [Erwinia persicina]